MSRDEHDLTWDAVNLSTVRDLIDQAIRVLRTVPDGEETAAELDSARAKAMALYARVQDQLGRWHPELALRR